jgi:hypothetical protein
MAAEPILAALDISVAHRRRVVDHTFTALGRSRCPNWIGNVHTV